VRTLNIGEHALCASAENLSTPVRHVALRCPEQSQIALMDKWNKQRSNSNVRSRAQSTAPHSLLRTVWALTHGFPCAAIVAAVPSTVVK
jgi:hypothetical protein